MDYDQDYGNHNYDYEHDRPRALTIIGKVIKYTITIFLDLLLLILFLRLFTSGDPRALKKFIWNDRAFAAYQTAPFECYTQSQTNFLTRDGKFGISNFKFCPEIDQVQFTIRYNNSTLEALREELLEENLPDEPFVFALIDDQGNIYKTYEYITDEKTVYNYRAVIFDGIELGSVKTLTVRFYHTLGAVDYDNPYGELLIYDSSHVSESVKLSKPSGANKALIKSSPKQ